MNQPTAVRAAAPIQLAWGALVSTDFAKAIFALCKHLRWHPEHASWLMACMAFESGRAFSPSIRNAAAMLNCACPASQASDPTRPVSRRQGQDDPASGALLRVKPGARTAFHRAKSGDFV